jgi:glycerophosphoryl diester phosphodiesterase
LHFVLEALLLAGKGVFDVPLIYGHRGARGERAENTIAGFLHAKNVGVNGIETDIAMTADLVPVMHHDPGLSDGRLIKRLARADMPDVPTLAETLAAVTDMSWLLEMKTFPPQPEQSHPPRDVVRRVLETLDAAGADPERIAIKAFDWEVLREVARQRPGLRRICLTAPDTAATPDIWWGRDITTRLPEAVAETGAYAWSAFHRTLNAENVARAKKLGLQVLAWTVNDPADFDRLAPLVNGIVTDFPSRFLPRPRSGSGLG